MALFMADKNKTKSKKKASHLNETVLKFVDGMSPQAANLVIDAYGEIPYVVKDALDDYYSAKAGISSKEGIDAVRQSLEGLKSACDANPDYMKLYDAAKEDANQEIAEMYANGGMSV